ncbi:MAG: autotransporter-associated beta strand repeat-containing protein [Planctomycetota bacterium]
MAVRQTSVGLLALCLLAAGGGGSTAVAQLRILDYNVGASSSSSSGPRPGMDAVLQAIASQTRPGFAGPIDILLLQEADSVVTTGSAYAALLNTLTGGTAYRSSTVDGLTTGAGRPITVYNSAAVSLLGEVALGTVGTSVQPRQTMRYQFRPVGYDASANFYVYNSHLKASNDSTSENRRNIELSINRANADALGEGTHVIYAGDWNLYTASEAGFQTMLAAGAGQAFDPISQVGSWSGNAAYKPYHTQSPATTAAYGGQVTGGVNDRFDFQMVSGEWLDGRGLDYIAGSYWAFGNTATHAMNGAITTGSAAALQAYLPGYSLAASGTILTNLSRVTDHLPVVADYQLPAKLAASLGSVPATVIRGASVSTTLAVSNAAPVEVVQGADRLDYSFAGSGGCVGSGTGSDLPLGGANSHTLALATASAGLLSGTVSVTATSPQTASPTFSQGVSLNVLDHALGSFTSGSSVASLDVDFGTLTQGTGPASRSFNLFNRVGTLGSAWTAGLDLDAVAETDPAAIFSSTLAPFLNLASGSSRAFDVSMLTTTSGSFVGSYLLSLSDQDLPGATPQSLTLSVRGSVVAPATAVLNVASGTSTQLQLGFASIGGAAAVTKTGGGTAILDAVNTYAGQTSVTQGVLAVTGSTSISSSPLIDVQLGATLDLAAVLGGYTLSSGQTLGGSGTILGSLVFGRGSTLSPGVGGGLSASAAAIDLAATSPVSVPEPGLTGAGLLAAALLACRRLRGT